MLAMVFRPLHIQFRIRRGFLESPREHGDSLLEILVDRRKEADEEGKRGEEGVDGHPSRLPSGTENPPEPHCLSVSCRTTIGT